MVKKWDTQSEISFFCYTEDATGIDSNIKIINIQFPEAYDKWWFKIPLLVEPALEKYAKKVLFDLDIIIHGDLDFIDRITADNLTVCLARWKDANLLNDTVELNTLYNSSIMIWKDARYVYDVFSEQEDFFMVKYKGVDRFLHHENLDVDVIPAGIVYSYKKGADLSDNTPYTFRENYKVALFHQFPKQHNLTDHMIVQQYWK